MRSQLMLTPFFFNRFGLFESFYVLKCHMYLFYKSSKSHYIEKSRIVFITFSSVDRDDFNFFFIKQKPSVKLTGISIVKLKWNHEFCMNGFERWWRRKNAKTGPTLHIGKKLSFPTVGLISKLFYVAKFSRPMFEKKITKCTND